MSNSYEYCVREVTDINRVGVGLGEVNDQDRVCIGLEGTAINPQLDAEWNNINWTSLTPAAAKELYHLLGLVKHIWGE